MIIAAFALVSVAPPACPGQYPAFAPPIPPEEGRIGGRSSPPFGDALGDAWEMTEVACWQGTWLRRGKSNLWDGYWVNPNGERVRATLESWINGRRVTMVRRHERGKYCRYDGTISPDWWEVSGRYTCTWERTPMPWRAQIVRMAHSNPALLREQ
jgi:hypothetical protein